MPRHKPMYFRTRKSHHFHFYNITDEGIFKAQDPNHSRMVFWSDIFNEYKHLWNTKFNFNLVWRTNK